MKLGLNVVGISSLKLVKSYSSSTMLSIMYVDMYVDIYVILGSSMAVPSHDGVKRLAEAP